MLILLDYYPTPIFHQFSIEGDVLKFASGAGDVVFFGEFVVETRYESGLDAAAFLVDGVLGAVDNVLNLTQFVCQMLLFCQNHDKP